MNGIRIFATIAFAAAMLAGSLTASAQDPSTLNTSSGTKSAFPKSNGPVLPSTEVDKSAPLYLQGDQLIYDSDGSKVTARGNVEIYYNNYVLTSDEVVYDQSAGTLTAVGNVQLKEPNGSIIRADRYTLTDDFRDGFVESLSVVATDDTRVVARRAVRRDGDTTIFTDGKFTPCKTTDGAQPLWCISAKRVIHDQKEATISYQDAQFEFLGVPIAYLPYFQHADPSVKRKSGFLPPQFGGSDELGYGAEIPYYFALAPNYDFLFHPKITSKQGVLWQGEFRHRLANGQYKVNLAGIDQDGGELNGASLADQQELDGFRGSLETVGLFSVSSWWKAGWDITLESDDTFRRFYQLDNILIDDRVNSVFLRGQSDRNYFGATFYQFGALSSDDSPQSESRVHPVIDHNYVLDQPILGGELSFESNATSFSRRDSREDGSSQQNITRAHTSAKWRRKLIDDIGISYTPFAEIRGDVMRFNNVVDPLTNQNIDNESVARGLALGGVTVSYPWIASTSNASHTIEPIGQIIGRQSSLRQADLPNEDARSLVFDDTNLFNTSKFSGFDRVETGTRANVGVQYTFQSFNGGYARLLAGQSFQISGQNAYQDPGNDFVGNEASDVAQRGFIRSPNSGLETSQSDYVLGAYIAPIDNFRLISQSRFDEDDFDLEREDATAAMSFGPITTSATYTYVAAAPELGFSDSQSEISGNLGLRLTNHWSIGASIRYDIDSEFRLTDTFRIQYADDCFALTTSYTESFIDDPARDLEPDRTLFVRFEFKHLGDFGYKTDALSFDDDVKPGAG
ncbi:MAG: LPS-assembly protein LptD [Hyphomicrobiaceae bacterium]